MSNSVKVSIIIPAFNEYHNLSELLLPLDKTTEIEQGSCEIIVVDGGSTDGSVMLAKQFSSKTIETNKGRARQLNAGAKIAKGEFLWFIHADSLLNFNEMENYLNVISYHNWGFFKVNILSPKPIFGIISALINLRSKISKIATGDQGIFIKKSLFLDIGGFQDQLLMEDIELSKQLKHKFKPFCSRLKIGTSARKWQKEGIMKTIILMWILRFRYFIGANPDELAKKYYHL